MDPELAGPWHLLFKQVQSPRHVLSELLQNADDAGATEAAVRIEDESFVFTHNGRDFTEEEFRSLCRFGYSNKRALHTIGFRGIGFKSTFSLGGRVELYTPTLSVAFGRSRFTEPIWSVAHPDTTGLTMVRVAIADQLRQRELGKNLEEWLRSPVSLLFFRHIRRLLIGDRQVHWTPAGSGPTSRSKWFSLNNELDTKYLVVQSKAEPFPDEALKEIKEERLLGREEDPKLPACRVEIVLGVEGRLYVVLPTGVKTDLPFACNAPFIQDPARLEIKSPATSPTNKWLLERTGQLAATIMLEWLGDKSRTMADRASSYDLLPDVDREDNSLEGVCAAIVELEFAEKTEGAKALLTDSGALRAAGQCTMIPARLFDVWSADQAAALLDEKGQPALSRQVSAANRAKLVNWDLIEEITREQVVAALHRVSPPKPKSWRNLMVLWAYLEPVIRSYFTKVKEIRISPVQGRDILYSAAEVARIGSEKVVQSESDWEFLSENLLVLNQSWVRFLKEQEQRAEQEADEKLEKLVSAAMSVLEELELDRASDVSTVIGAAAARFGERKKVPLEDFIRLAQIAAKLDAEVGEEFPFVTKDRVIRNCSSPLLSDTWGALEGLLPEKWCEEHVLHPDYVKSFQSCTAEEWAVWIHFGKAKILCFAPFLETKVSFWSRSQFEASLRKRGCSPPAEYRYRSDRFVIHDRDFDNAFWQYWELLAKEDDAIWGRIVELIFKPSFEYLDSGTVEKVRAYQISQQGYLDRIPANGLLTGWLLKFRELRCLPDTRGFLYLPSELLRRTSETESLIDVEPFVHGRLDTEVNRRLLTLLGVGATPTGPDRLLERLRALAKAAKPPVDEVEKWYRRLDQISNTASTGGLAQIKEAFCNEKIILTESGEWISAPGVFLSANEEDVPGAAVVRRSVADLALWRKIGIADRPTADLAIRWLGGIPSGQKLSPDDQRRVKSMLARHAMRIWEDCGHWLNLADEWVPVNSLKYALTMQTLVSWANLFENTKRQTADLRFSAEITEAAPFLNLPRLAVLIEDRLHGGARKPSEAVKKPWLTQFGTDLCRARLGDEQETSRVRRLASDLAGTVWQAVSSLRVEPYIGGVPAGTPRRAHVAWLERVLYVEQLPPAKLARLVPEVLAARFDRADLAAALNYCYERSANDVAEYLQENFTLESPDLLVAASGTGIQSGTIGPQVSKGEDSSSESSVHEPVAADVDGDANKESDSGGGRNGGEHPHPSAETGSRTTAPVRPAKPSLMEDFARREGFRKTGESGFRHLDGRWLARTEAETFPWLLRNSSGDVLKYFWPSDQCLDKAPVELEAEVWHLINEPSGDYALVLRNGEGQPVELTGRALREGVAKHELSVNAATFRISKTNVVA